MPLIGVITGMAREADCLDDFPAEDAPLVRVAGARADRAYTLAGALISDGCEALVSFGTAGGLIDGLGTGDLVLAGGVIAPDGRTFETDGPWRQRFKDAFGASHGGHGSVTVQLLAGSRGLLATSHAKRALFVATSAAAVDMESHAVGLAAAEAGVPFLVVRVVADPVSRAIPEWLLGCIGEDGRTRYGAVLSGLAGHPGDLLALIGLGGVNAKAIAALRRVAGLAGPLFRFQ